MTFDDVLALVRSLDGSLVQLPGPGDGTPEIAWGDAFVHYAPDGQVPTTTQPYATVVTKDYPGDDRSGLDRDGAFRVNVAAGREAFVRWTGHEPREGADGVDPAATDVVMAHPVYGSLGWLAVVDPAEETSGDVADLLRLAHDLARARHERRTDS